MNSDEFDAEQNRLIADLARKMLGVGIFRAAIGVLALASMSAMSTDGLIA